MSGIIGGAGSRSGIVGKTELELDYEEGEWTGDFSSGSGSVTIDNSTGVYTKIGRLVNVSGAFTAGSVSSPSGSLVVTGLPFTTASGGMKHRSVGSISGWNYTGTITTDLHCFQSSGYTYFYIQDQGLNDVANHVQAATEFRFTLSYIVN